MHASTNYFSSWMSLVILAVICLTESSWGSPAPAPDLYTYENYMNSIPKRAGFVGMRGKKSSSSSSDYFPEEDESADESGWNEKRAQFLGMRGKKAFESAPVAASNQQQLLDLLNSMEKRRPEFMGMRGKKQDVGGTKRAGFVGMRGKKRQMGYVPSSLNRMLGLKGFVAMRG